MRITNRLLSVILAVTLLVGVAIPISIFAATGEENEPKTAYESTLRNVSDMVADGWKGYYSSDPQAGVPFENKDLDYLFECWGGGITRTQKGTIKWSNDWQGNPFSKMGAATYTARKYKYFTLTVEYKFQKNETPWPVVTFGQPNETPEMFYVKINGSKVNDPKYNKSVVGAYIQYEGHLNISGKNALAGTNSTKNIDGSQWHKLTLKVTPGKLYSAISDLDGNPLIETNSSLSDEYEEGYISLMLNGLAFYRNFSIVEEEVDDYKIIPYENDLRNVDALMNEGWSGAYSADPQDAVAFEDIAANELYECWGGGITRQQNKYYHWKGFNWKDPFINMGALTYTAQKYKYFTMTVDYKFGGRNNVWPAISFGQPNTTPEMFYAPIAYSDVQSTPKEVGDDAIGVYVQYEGYVNIAGKNATGASNVNAFDTTDWHTMRISVIPGMVEVILYDNEGNAVSTATAILSDDYEGGYISLMMGVPYSFFRNFSITEYDFIDMSQTDESNEVKATISKDQCKHPIVVKTDPKRLYDFESIFHDEESNADYEIKNLTSDIFIIEAPRPSVLTVKYAERKLDYDPEYTLKYYFDWEEDLNDFKAYRTPNPADSNIEKVNLNDIWKIRDGILQKPVIDFSGTDKTSDPWSDFNILMLNTQKFRNFELTVQYKHGKKGGFACGVIFGSQDPTFFTDVEQGGIFAAVESDARGLLQGKSIRNRDDLFRIMPGEGRTNLLGYPKYDTEQIHTMRIKVLEGRAYMYIDDIEKPVTAIIPKDFYGNISLAVGNNLAWYDNLTIQPLDEWGNKITLKENEKQSKFNPQDIETDTWVDNSEWD